MRFSRGGLRRAWAGIPVAGISETLSTRLYLTEGHKLGFLNLFADAIPHFRTHHEGHAQPKSTTPVRPLPMQHIVAM
jgi:hypothetical protein